MKIAHITFKGDELYGPLQKVTYADGSPALLIGSDVVSINLSAYGLVPPEDHVYVKDWSDGQGMTQALEDAGVVVRVSQVTVGQFNSPAWLVRVL